MPKPGYTGLRRVYKATLYSWQGLMASWRYESAFRQECTLALILTPVAFLLAEDIIQLILMVGVLAIVLITELLNSAVESVVDRVGDEFNELAGRAKDQGSAAVFVSLALVVLVWGGIIAHNFVL
jgi:diacylglycerol kinase (ATP)